MEKKIRAIIPAAGQGKRLRAISGDLPKAMFCVNGKPMLELVMENISFVQPQDVYVVVGYGKEKIIEHFGEQYHFVEQKQQLGTAH